MTHLDLMHATDWTPAYRVRGWLVQEKLDGGEGCMLRDPRAGYVAGRTRTMMKFKSRSLYK